MGAMLIRPAQPADESAITEMLAVCGVFNEEEIRAARELVHAGVTQGDYSLLTLEIGGAVRGYACFGETPLTASTWDLYWLCIHPAAQRTGAARALQAEVESFIRRHGGERIRVETSGRADYERARAFYLRAGFQRIGLIPDFYRASDDCVIFCKELSPTAQTPPAS